MKFSVGFYFLIITSFLLTGCHDRFGAYKPNMNKATSKPYKIKGVTYRPQRSYDYDEIGQASYYGDGDGFHGKKTSTGEVYNHQALTAAHKTLPIPCVVEVKNLSNGKKVKLVVNDRGPFVKGRIIDVSTAAAKQLGFHRQGIARVRVRSLVEETKALHKGKNWSHYKPAQREMLIPVRQNTTPKTGRKPTYMTYGSLQSRMPPIEKKPSFPAAQQASSGTIIQAGAFSNIKKAQTFKSTLQKHAPSLPIQIHSHPVKPLNILKIGPFKSTTEAQRYLQQLQKLGYKDFYIAHN